MQPDWNATVPQPGTTSVAVDSSAQNRVLRNTYWLLALTMIPTVIGAMAGASFSFGAIFKTYPIMAPIGMFVIMLGLLFGVSAARNSVWGV
ncbi:MAG: BAX inhibitor (BI)-1/YccA family protein, partial [Vicinamibacterales bacterium]